MSRPDQSILYLRKLGYCVLRLPRSDFRPGQTLLREGSKDLLRLGDLGKITIPGPKPLPKVSRDNVAPGSISGQRTSSMKMEIGVELLRGLLTAMGGDPSSLAAAYSGARTLTFQFDDVAEDHIDVDALDQYLSAASFEPDQRAVINGLLEDAIYVITSVIKTRKLGVHVGTGSNTAAGFNAPAIQAAAKAAVRVDTAGLRGGNVVYEGETPVVFGFQAVQILTNEEGEYTTFKAVAAGEMAARKTEQPPRSYLSLNSGVFFRVRD